MLADQNERAIELGREPLRMAQQLGLDALHANILNSIGSARSALGDRKGLVELEESIELAAKANSIDDLLRGHNNLVPMSVLYGELERAQAGAEETLRLARHYGHRGFARFMEGGAMITVPYHCGKWDQALEYAEPFLAIVERGSPHYQAATAYCFRGLIRIGRGDSEGAESDAERGVEIARPIEDPQSLQSVLAMASAICLLAGNARRAEEIVNEALGGFIGLRQLGFVAVEMHHLAWSAFQLGREADVLAVIRRETFRSPWAEVVEAVAGGDFGRAADILAGIGATTAEAFYRLRTAKQLVADGRRAEAEEQLGPALAFYRSQGAIRYQREGESLLAASA
jgi:tetratricopeptide (TPR) repeat protein